MLEFLLLRVEADFYNYRKNKNLFLKTGLSNQLDTGHTLDILDFVRGFEKNIFSNIEDLTDADFLLLEEYKNTFNKKRSFLKQLIDVYASGHQDNLVQFAFYKLLEQSLDSILEKKHKAFTDKEEFLNAGKIVNEKKFPEGTVLPKDLHKVPKPFIKISPDKIVSGFESLVQQGFCEIGNIPAFVYDAFEFPASYGNKQQAGFYYFLWPKKARSFISMIRELKNRRSLDGTQSKLTEWISALLPIATRGTIEKTLRDKEKKPSKNNHIDIQIFN